MRRETLGLFKRNRKSTRKAAGKWNTGRKAENSTGNVAVKEAAESAQEDLTAAAQETPAAQMPEEAPAAQVKPDGVSAQEVFRFFREIASIPHGSHHTEQISDYLVTFAKERDLPYVQDDANNVIITKKATEGFENAEPIALQGHIDMVLASEPDKKIDMLKEAITILEDGDWMYADGTTLGADNGIAVAMMLAALDSDEIRHPLLECVFTSDEEVGLIGASAIDLSGLKSRRLLNLDSEDEGVFCAGCAGGAEVVCEMPLKRKSRDGKVLRVKVSGLMGGHSGVDIHNGGANATRLLSRALHTVYREAPFRLVSINGGDADNAIPTNAEAEILIEAGDDADRLPQLFERAGKELAAEYTVTDPKMSWNTEWEDAESAECISKKKTRALISYMLSLPTGITHLNPVLKGMAQTSLNMGIVRTFKDHLLLEFMIRSGVNTQTGFLCDRVVCITEGFGGKATVRSSYPAWEYRQDSPFRDLAIETYKGLTGSEPKVEVIHAGLECGILSGKLPELDCISAGPTLQNVHTVRERMSKSSVENVWQFVLALLEKAAGSEE